jgi:hypothetical protein
MQVHCIQSAPEEMFYACEVKNIKTMGKKVQKVYFSDLSGAPLP